MDEATLIRRYTAERPVLEAWGKFVAMEITKALQELLKKKAKNFIRIPPEPRLKDDASLIDKAFFRAKPYVHPYEEITDKVGVRFVVLLSRDLDMVGSVIERGIDWSYSKDRDHKEERDLKPLIFDYQSDHYILRPRKKLTFNGIDIPETIACEVQVRTLLQHAYCELTHDTIYKTTIKPGSEMYRAVARSMALLETADQQLMSVADGVGAQMDGLESAKATIAQKYEEFIGLAPTDSRFNDQIISVYQSTVLQATMPIKLSEFIDSNKYLKQSFLEGRTTDSIFMQSSSLILLMELARDHYAIADSWPFRPELLNGLYAILGISRS